MEQAADLDLNALLVFAEVVETKSLTQAAQRLGIPKSTVSRRISRLEQQSGTKLLRKHTRQLSITAIGEQLYQKALAVRDQQHAINALIHTHQQEPQGLLKIAIPVSMESDYFATVFCQTFLERHPKASLELQLVDRLVHPVNEGFDIAMWFGPLQDSTLHAKKIFDCDMQLCAAPSFLSQLPRVPRKPADIQSLPFVIEGVSGHRFQLKLQRGGQACEISPPIRAKVNSLAIAKHYALQGMGLTVLPKHLCATEITQGKLVSVLDNYQLPCVEIHMVYAAKLAYSPLITAFHQLLEELTNTAIAG